MPLSDIFSTLKILRLEILELMHDCNSAATVEQHNHYRIFVMNCDDHEARTKTPYNLVLAQAFMLIPT